MKKNLLLTIAATVMMIGFSSCNKEENRGIVREGFAVTLSFKNSSTRADGSSAVKDATVSIEDGYICFVNAGNAITDIYTISSSVTGGKNIKNSDLGSSAVTLSDVPGSSSKVYMIANTGTLSLAPVVGQSILVYMNNSVKVEDEGVYTEVTSVGNANLTPGGNDDEKNASITLSTNVSRIQMEDITFDGAITGTVAGIFINGYYATMQLDGTAGTLQSSMVSTDYADGTSVYPGTLKTYVYDMVNKAIAATVTPTNDVWGYNLFRSATPQIIIKLTSVTINGQSLATDQFITINGFKNGTTPIENLAGGMIYTIKAGSLVINPEHLSEVPGTTPMSVNVTVTTVTWEETEVIPNL